MNLTWWQLHPRQEPFPNPPYFTVCHPLPPLSSLMFKNLKCFKILWSPCTRRAFMSDGYQKKLLSSAMVASIIWCPIKQLSNNINAQANNTNVPPKLKPTTQIPPNTQANNSNVLSILQISPDYSCTKTFPLLYLNCTSVVIHVLGDASFIMSILTHLSVVIEHI